MFKATHGSNTHKGAIWTLGLLVAAAGGRVGQNAREIAAVAGAIARLPDRAQPQLITHGDIARSRYGAFGAREEACNDFPHVTGLALPALREQRAKGCSEEVSRSDALLSLMCQLDDTCVLYRGGIEALDLVKSGARAVLRAGGCASAQGRNWLNAFDRELIAKHISPGGSADLLAATIFLDAVERGQSEVRKDQSEWEKSDGKL
jgi:triphosphoribosyl-dephospho-CoA synthase